MVGGGRCHCVCNTGRKAQQQVLAGVQEETITSYFWPPPPPPHPPPPQLLPFTFSPSPSPSLLLSPYLPTTILLVFSASPSSLPLLHSTSSTFLLAVCSFTLLPFLFKAGPTMENKKKKITVSGKVKAVNNVNYLR